MGAYSFKSVGKTQAATAAEVLPVTPVPIGIKTPVRLGGDSGIFEMHTSMADQVHDNLRNLMLTNWGERLGLYNFGANLRPLTSELVAQEAFDAEAISRIRAAVAAWMPFVDLEDFASLIDHSENKNTAVYRITVTYNVPALGVKARALQVTLYAI